MDSYACPKCAGEMVQGFIPDSAHMGSVTAPRWVSGDPNISKWTGALKDAGRRDWWAVTVWRCGGCGFLEHWALEQTEPPSWWG